jgi:hypothetical protein
VAEGLKSLGLSDYTPEPRTPMSCLRAVLDDVYTPPDKEEKYVIRPHKNSVPGFAVVAERPKEHAEAGDDWGKIVAIAGLADDGGLKLDPYDYEKLEAITAGMKGAAQWLSGGAVTKSLVGLVEHFGGVALRPAGGVYWLNDWALDDWARVADLFEKASAHKDEDGKEQPPTAVYVMRVVADEIQAKVSIDGEMLKDFAGELNGILECRPCRVSVVYCDAEVKKVVEWEPSHGPLTLAACGGGGTYTVRSGTGCGKAGKARRAWYASPMARPTGATIPACPCCGPSRRMEAPMRPSGVR